MLKGRLSLGNSLPPPGGPLHEALAHLLDHRRHHNSSDELRQRLRQRDFQSLLSLSLSLFLALCTLHSAPVLSPLLPPPSALPPPSSLLSSLLFSSLWSVSSSRVRLSGSSSCLVPLVCSATFSLFPSLSFTLSLSPFTHTPRSRQKGVQGYVIHSFLPVLLAGRCAGQPVESDSTFGQHSAKSGASSIMSPGNGGAAHIESHLVLLLVPSNLTHGIADVFASRRFRPGPCDHYRSRFVAAAAVGRCCCDFTLSSLQLTFQPRK